MVSTLPIMKNMDECTTAIATTKDASCSNAKKRVVRFADVDGCRPAKRRLVVRDDGSTASFMTDKERVQRWRQQNDVRETVHDVSQIIQTCNASGNSQEDSYKDFAEAVAKAYNLCYEETLPASPDCNDEVKLPRLPLHEMIVWGFPHTASRGLESRTIPGLGGHRLQKRRELIRGVLGVQRELCSMEVSPSDIAEALGAVSEVLSKPSKLFARAMGVVDGTSALLEYTATVTTAATTRPGNRKETTKTPAMRNMEHPLSMNTFINTSVVA